MSARAFPLSQLPAPAPAPAPDAPSPRRRSRAVILFDDDAVDDARSNPSSIAGMSKRGVEPVRVRHPPRHFVRVAIAPRRRRRARRRRLVRMDESHAARRRVVPLPIVRKVRAPRGNGPGPEPGPGFARRTRVDVKP